MALIITAIIICDSCATRFGENNPLLKGYEQRMLARIEGWNYTGNKDLCPKCRPKRKDGEFKGGGKTA